MHKQKRKENWKTKKVRVTVRCFGVKLDMNQPQLHSIIQNIIAKYSLLFKIFWRTSPKNIAKCISHSNCSNSEFYVKLRRRKKGFQFYITQPHIY